MTPKSIATNRIKEQKLAIIFSKTIFIVGLVVIFAIFFDKKQTNRFDLEYIALAIIFIGGTGLLAVYNRGQKSQNIDSKSPLQFTPTNIDNDHLLINRNYLGHTVSGSFVVSGMFAYITSSFNLMADVYEIPPQNHNWLLIINFIGLVFCSLVNSQLLKITPASSLLYLALWAPFTSGILFALLVFFDVAPFSWFAICSFCFVASLGFIIPNATACALFSHRHRTAAATVMAIIIQFSCYTAAGLLVVLLQNGSLQSLSDTMSICGTCALIFFRVLVSNYDTGVAQKYDIEPAQNHPLPM